MVYISGNERYDGCREHVCVLSGDWYGVGGGGHVQRWCNMDDG